jgi:hypothetical protein
MMALKTREPPTTPATAHEPIELGLVEWLK